jgi:hypothetical protein
VNIICVCKMHSSQIPGPSRADVQRTSTVHTDVQQISPDLTNSQELSSPRLSNSGQPTAGVRSFADIVNGE